MSLRNPPVPRMIDTTIKPADPNRVYRNTDYVVLVMGPTGAGKSRFIEALAGNDALGISKDQLQSYTQTITAYDLLDISVSSGTDEPFTIDPEIRNHILDSPGFSDSEIPELKIIQMVNDWMKTHNINIHTILYLCPITDTRLSGSKRRTIDMLKMLGGIDTDTPGAVYVVTTMWDRIWNERGRLAAEERFAQLRDDIWRDLPDTRGTKSISRFMNTRESALEIVGNTFTWTSEQKPRPNLYDAYDRLHVGPLNRAPFIPHLYRELLDRIDNVRQQERNLELELSEPDVQSNAELRLLLEERRSNVVRLLTAFEMQLIDFGEPPVGFESVTPLREALITKHYPDGIQPLTADHHQGRTKTPSKLSSVKRTLVRSLKFVKDAGKRRK